MNLPRLAARSVIVTGGLALVVAVFWGMYQGHDKHVAHVWPWPMGSHHPFMLFLMGLTDTVVAIGGFVGGFVFIFYLFKVAEWELE